MGLNHRQYADLSAALRSAYDDYDPLRRLISQNTEYKLENYVSDTHSILTVIDKLIDGAQQHGWIYQLIQVAVEENPTNPLLLNFIKDYPEFDPANAPPAPPDYYKTYFVNASYLFVGRNELRDKLRRLHETEDSSHVLLVVGARVSGKTYTRELISYLASKSPPHKAVYIDLDRFIYQPYDIVKEIAENMGISREEIETIPIQNQEQATRYVHFLCTWLHNQIVRMDDKIWWIVFDGFRLINQLSETKYMISALAEKIEKEIRDKCYLVLLNYTNILPQEIDFYAEREEIKMVDREELILFFEHLFEENEKTYPREDFEKVVDEIFNQAEAQIIALSEGDSEKLKTLQEERLKYRTMATNMAVRRFKQNGFVL